MHDDRGRHTLQTRRIGAKDGEVAGEQPGNLDCDEYLKGVASLYVT